MKQKIHPIKSAQGGLASQEFNKARKAILATIVFASLFCLAQKSQAAVIFEDNFDSRSSTWNCTQDMGGPWLDASYSHCYTHPTFGPVFKMGPGNNSTNAVYSWKRHDAVGLGGLSDYCGDLWYVFSQPYPSEIYMRWYMKVPPSNLWDKTGELGFKFWRFLTSAGGEIYLNASTIGSAGNLFSNASIAFFGDNFGQWQDACPISSFNDDTWHSHELHIKLNSTATSNDGILEYWLDGVRTYRKIDLTYDAASNSGISHLMEFGIGNTTIETAFMQTAWSAIAFDDVVIADSYIGPISEDTDTTAPASPSGLSVS